ncbi:raffinose/stachyose/melibiose transport system substrate-binding protein [Paenibacillus taihuensis]|uniref:Raffinose/stachyose/melibiose transport system substrate-binding protein n=1 Tax=Paenibacillus taihuensis TaxID=1156355 RepID=A0A3D9SLC3_9BACL|nr:extracellular solute-binding protein [Paenibacillus taihuensis]REE92705.1 raffinose/stachyose/melibiose transport system substrate-binding protein [Paenibacillus taihuensis]
MSKKKWLSSMLAIGLITTGILSGCGKDSAENANQGAAENNTATTTNNTETAASADPVKLKLAIWDAKADIDFWTEKAKEYSAQKPNVTIEVEKVPDNSGQYLKVRLAANDMPDLFYLKPAAFQVYKETMLPLDDLQATATNKFATKIDGKVLGLPLVSFSEFVYYHPSIFKALNLEVPKTLPQFLDVMAKLKADGQYTPLSIGGKDDWTFYPFMEFGPHLMSGDEDYMANLAKNKAPFGAGSTFDQVANLLKEISDKKYAGPDALSISFDQSTQQFEAGKAAMIALGQWYYPSYMDKVKSDEDLGAFPLPFRADESQPLTSMTLSDMNVGINKDSKNTEEAKAFLEWMFSKDVYQSYINTMQQSSTIDGVTVDNPFFNKWTQQYPFTPFIYNATDAGFAKVSSAAQYDTHKIAQSIFAGKSIGDLEKELNDKWGKAVDSNQ